MLDDSLTKVAARPALDRSRGMPTPGGTRIASALASAHGPQLADSARVKSVLVAYGSKRGGTTGIAESIAATLREQGLKVDCVGVTDACNLARYDAIVIGGAVYAHRWIGIASRFIRRNARVLRSKPVWLFSSGPLDDSATQSELASVPHVAALGARIGARDHVTFGGRLHQNQKGFLAAAVARAHAGDWRDWQRIRDWSLHLAVEIENAAPITAPAKVPARWPLVLLCLAVALTTLGCGIALVIAPDGSLAQASSWLAHSPFTTFAIPGLLLAGVVGLTSAIAVIQIARYRPNAMAVAELAGAALLGWVAMEMILLRTVNALQLLYFAVAIVIVVVASRHQTYSRKRVTAS